MNRYLITFTYFKDLDKSFRYDELATKYIQFISNGLYIYNIATIEIDTQFYYDKIVEVLIQYCNIIDENILLVPESFNVKIMKLEGIHIVDNIIVTSNIFESDSIEVYNGELKDMVYTLSVKR
jgi:hypothetical protein